MTVTPINDIPGGLSAIARFTMMYGSKLAPADGDHLMEITANTSPVVQMCDTIELLYAKQNEITDSAAQTAARTLIAQLVPMVTSMGWHGFNSKVDATAGAYSRGAAINASVLRGLGEPNPMGGKWPDASKDPAPDQRYTPPAPVAPPTPAEGAPPTAPATTPSETPAA